MLLASQAFGLQGYTVISNSLPTNAWIKFTFTKTNGQAVVVAVTNLSGGDSPALVGQLFAAINANPGLQGSDGVLADDYVLNPGAATFNLYARSPGYQAAAIQVLPSVSAKVYLCTPRKSPSRKTCPTSSPETIFTSRPAHPAWP